MPLISLDLRLLILSFPFLRSSLAIVMERQLRFRQTASAPLEVSNYPTPAHECLSLAKPKCEQSLSAAACESPIRGRESKQKTLARERSQVRPLAGGEVCRFFGSRLRLEKRHSEQAANRIAVFARTGKTRQAKKQSARFFDCPVVFGQIHLGRLKLMVTCV